MERSDDRAVLVSCLVALTPASILGVVYLWIMSPMGWGGYPEKVGVMGRAGAAEG